MDLRRGVKCGLWDEGGNGEVESSRRRVVKEVNGGGEVAGKSVAERAVARNSWVRSS